ncbi:MAG: FAD-dependent oxidoreductase [Deltaproteobacteria bacterium]|nr:FAD-dependent oxidoreductase [Deltaproteobacteria bacterium]
MSYSHLFKTFTVKGLVIPNRTVMAPMGNNLSGREGIVTPRTTAYYLERARGGVGMIITEAVAVSLTGRHRVGGLVLFDGPHEDGLKQLVEAIHKGGSKVAIQLNHGGRLVDPQVSGGRVVGPSDIPFSPGAPLPHPLTVTEIAETISDFSRAAQRAVEIGFDAIEIHGAHGYLIHQFFSPRSNQRSDEYGGSLENRMRFPVQVARAVREAVGESVPLIFRLSAEEYEEGGFELSESLALGKQLRETGIDILHVSGGTTERPQSSMYCIQPGAMPEGCLIHFSERFRKEVGPPVIGVGRIVRPEFADRVIEEQKADMVAMGRSLLADPQWPNKASDKVSGPIRRCIGCNRCIESISSQKPIVCSVNPVTGNEDELPLKRPQEQKKIVVVGAGPAGLEAACTGAFLGHRVSLYEQRDQIGGQLREASIPPGKATLKSIVDYYESRLADLKVDVHLGEKLTEKTLEGREIDAVIMATGSQPIRPPIPGADAPHVMTALDVLKGSCQPGERVLVVGGGLVGCETAEFLSAQGKAVHLIEMMDHIAQDVEPRARLLLLERLKKLGVDIMTGCELHAIDHDGAVLDKNGQHLTLSADSVVLAVGTRADNMLAMTLQKGGWVVYPIGDCRTPGNIKEAVHQGFRVIYKELNDAI